MSIEAWKKIVGLPDSYQLGTEKEMIETYGGLMSADRVMMLVLDVDHPLPRNVIDKTTRETVMPKTTFKTLKQHRLIKIGGETIIMSRALVDALRVLGKNNITIRFSNRSQPVVVVSPAATILIAPYIAEKEDETLEIP